MNTKEAVHVFEWKIENFSHWREEVHGNCLVSSYYSSSHNGMELYPKGVNGNGEYLVVCLLRVRDFLTAELSFYSSTGVLLGSKQQVQKNRGTNLELPPGPKLKEVLERVQGGDDILTVKLRVRNQNDRNEKCVCTTINVSKMSLNINPRWIEEMESDETNDFFYVQLSPEDNLDRMWLQICSEKNALNFTITPPTTVKHPFAVEMCWTGTDDESCEKQEHIFTDNSPWTFPDSLPKKEVTEKKISLLLLLTTKYFIRGPFHMNCAYSRVSIEPNNTLCFSEEEPSTDPATSNKVEVLAKYSRCQTSDLPDDSVLVLSKELMCLYQDQGFSDVTLKCDSVSFPVHRAILSARSPVFKAMLSIDMTEAASGTVDIGDLDPSSLGLFLTYLYTGVLEDLQYDSALMLYYAADKYQVPSLKRDCSKFLCGNVSISNVCDFLSLADRHEDDKLATATRNFILNHYNEVLGSKEWKSFMKSEPLLALQTLTNFGEKGVLVKRKRNPE